MKRFRLSTLMLLVIIAALGFALVVQDQRAKRREASLEARLARKEYTVLAPLTTIIYEPKRKLVGPEADGRDNNQGR